MEWLLSTFSKRRVTACEKYRQFVAEGKTQPSPWELLKNQVFLGDEKFVNKIQDLTLIFVNIPVNNASPREPIAAITCSM
ncbi:MAG: hypothetical protein COA42_24345 [Alteromonadaceae bacterium]|nr:MAG: hypothetical protein COA42_24345 [Alteromonadaceae bacterium]